MRNLTMKRIANATKNITVKRAMNTATNMLETTRQLSVLHSLPQTVDIVLTRACDLKCLFCKNYETPGAKQISIENFQKVARQLFPTARNLFICSGGEPYLHGQLIADATKRATIISHRHRGKKRN